MAKGQQNLQGAPSRHAEACYVHGLVAFRRLSHRYPLKIERGNGRNIQSPLRTCFTGRKTWFCRKKNYKSISLFSCQKNIVDRKNMYTLLFLWAIFHWVRLPKGMQWNGQHLECLPRRASAGKINERVEKAAVDLLVSAWRVSDHPKPNWWTTWRVDFIPKIG